MGQNDTLQSWYISCRGTDLTIYFRGHDLGEKPAHLISSESSISSTPACRLFAKTGGIETTIEACTTRNSFPLSVARALPLSNLLEDLTLFPFSALSFLALFVDGSTPWPMSAEACLRFLAFLSIDWDMIEDSETSGAAS